MTENAFFHNGGPKWPPGGEKSFFRVGPHSKTFLDLQNRGGKVIFDQIYPTVVAET